MPVVSLQRGFARLDAMEGRICVPFNLVARHLAVRSFFKAVSRLGDGVAWYAMLAVLPLAYGPAAWWPCLAMIATGLVGLHIYKALKSTLVRERPFMSHWDVEPVAAPLDRYSFPSGHTMHATAFMVQLAHFFPDVMWLMLPFAVSVAVSRVVLGLHYPTDVAAGALIGWGLARLSLAAVAALGI